MIKLLHGCYSDMFRINGFIQLSILLVYSLRWLLESAMEMSVYFYKIFIGAINST